MTTTQTDQRTGDRLNTSEIKLWHLKQCPLFANLSQQELGAIFDSSKLVVLDPGETAPPPPGDEPSIWVVKRGYVKLTCVDEGGRDGAILILSPGDIFGSILPGDEAVFGENCTALTAVCLARLSRSRFDTLMRRFPDLGYRITKASFDRIQRLQIRVGELLMRSVEERLALALLELDRVVGEPAEEGAGRALNVPLSHRDLAQLVGSSREMVTHVMGRLREKGLVDTGARKNVILRDVEALRKIAQK